MSGPFGRPDVTPTRRIEHFVNCETGEGVDRDFEGTVPGEAVLIPDPAVARREEALARLKTLALTDEVVADILTVLGVNRE